MLGITVNSKQWGPLMLSTVPYTLGTYVSENAERVVVVFLLKKQGTPSTWEAYDECVAALGVDEDLITPTSKRFGGTFLDGRDTDFGVLTLTADAAKRLVFNKEKSSDFLNGKSVLTPDALIKELLGITLTRKKKDKPAKSA